MRASHLMLPVLALAIALGSAGSVLSQGDKPDPEKLVNLGPCLDSKGNKVANAHIYRIDKVGLEAVPTGHPLKQKEVARCFCDWPTYKSLGGECVVDQAKKKPTKAECAKIAGARLKMEVKACESPVTTCLKTWGAQVEAASCTTGGLLAALTLAVTPEPWTKVVTVPALGAAMVNCGFNSANAADKCSPAWGTCTEPHLSEWKNAWDDKTQTCRARGP